MTTSSRPYLIRAFHEWMTDNGFTPHLLIDAEMDAAEVPREHVHEGRIVLNISPGAVQNLILGNDWIEFNARFGGVARSLRLPVVAVLAIYARENGQGMAFGQEPGAGPSPSGPDGGGASDAGKPVSKEASKRKRPTLKVVK